MKEMIIISGIFPHKVSEGLYKALLAIYPESRTKGSVDMRLPKEDPRISQALKVLQESGLSPGDRYRPLETNEFSLRIRRLYEIGDYEKANYLVPMPKTSLGNATVRSASGLLKLEAKYLRLGKDIGFAASFWIIVSTRMKELIELSDLKRISLRSTEVVGSRSNHFKDQFWELTSDLRLPPLTSYCQLKNDDGLPFNGDYERGCIYTEGLYEQPEFHYKADDLAAVEPFDLALTQERFGIREWVADSSWWHLNDFIDFVSRTNSE